MDKVLNKSSFRKSDVHLKTLKLTQVLCLTRPGLEMWRCCVVVLLCCCSNAHMLIFLQIGTLSQFRIGDTTFVYV